MSNAGSSDEGCYAHFSSRCPRSHCPCLHTDIVTCHDRCYLHFSSQLRHFRDRTRGGPPQAAGTAAAVLCFFFSCLFFFNLLNSGQGEGYSTALRCWCARLRGEVMGALAPFTCASAQPRQGIGTGQCTKDTSTCSPPALLELVLQ